MNKLLLTLSTSLVILSVNTNTIANELNTTSWNFPTPEESIISQGKLLLFCDANPSKCPVGLYNKRSGIGGTGSGGSLVDPNTTSSANNISVVLAGDGSSVVLNTSQDSEGNDISSESETNSTIDTEEVLNISNN